MATTTTNLSLRKPESTDLVSVALDLSANYQTIDDKWASVTPAALGSSASAGSNLTVARSDHAHNVGSGTVAAPGLAVGETGTGLYRPGSSQLAAAVGGALSWLASTSSVALEKMLAVKQQGAPGTPASGYNAFYPKSDDHWYTKNSAGTEVQLLDLGAAGTYGQGLVTNASASVVFADQLNQNPIINGDFNLWPDATSFTTIADATKFASTWKYNKVGAMVHTVARDTSVPTLATAHMLSKYSLLVDCTTVDSSIASTDVCYVEHIMKGYHFLPFAQRAFVLSFWVKSTKTGTHCVAFRNSGSDRSYVAEYTVSVSDTWEYKSVSVSASPSAGTWDYTTGVGLSVIWTLTAGSNFQTTAGAWATGNFVGTSSQVNVCDNTANNFQIAQARMTLGTVSLPFAPRPYTLERVAAIPLQVYQSLEVSVNPTTASGTYATMNGDGTSSELRLDPTTAGGDFLAILLTTNSNDGGGNATFMKFTMDGAGTLGEQIVTAPAANYGFQIICMYRWTALSAGAHTIRAQWKVNGGTTTSSHRVLIGMEFAPNVA